MLCHNNDEKHLLVHHAGACPAAEREHSEGDDEAL